MAANARDRRGAGTSRGAHRLHHGLVTSPAVRLRDVATAWRCPDGLRKRAGREVVRVPEPVARLGGVLAQEIVWNVAVVAHRHRSMTALDPAVILLVHHMAVRACARGVAHIGPAPRIRERVGPEPEHCTQQNGTTTMDALKPWRHASSSTRRARVWRAIINSSFVGITQATPRAGGADAAAAAARIDTCRPRTAAPRCDRARGEATTLVSFRHPAARVPSAVGWAATDEDVGTGATAPARAG